MVEIIWTEPAWSDLEAIADYIALDKPVAARRLVQRVFRSGDVVIWRDEVQPDELAMFPALE